MTASREVSAPSSEREATLAALRATVARFGAEEVTPVLSEMDEREVFPEATVRRMKELGFFGLPIPEEYGGLGLGKTGYCAVMEELSKVDASHAAILGAHTSLGMTPLYYFGTEDQKQRYLVPAARGDRLMAFSLTEPGSGSDSGALVTSARADGDFFLLNGEKIYVTNGAEANLVLVLAANDVKLGPRGGITAFLVEKGTRGFTVGRLEKKMGLHGTSTAQLLFQDCAVPKENVLGDVGRGFVVAMTALDVGRLSLGAGSLGGMQGALREALTYAKNRLQFDLPIVEHQAIQFKLADMAMHIHALKTMVYAAAEHQDRMGPLVKGWTREDRAKKTRDSAIIKCLASEWATRTIHDALQIHGGLGYIRGTPIERAYRDARISEIFEGTNEIQRLVVARDLITRGWVD